MRTVTENNTLTIFLSGRIDTNNAPETEREISRLTEGRNEDIVVDAEELEYMPPAAKFDSRGRFCLYLGFPIL